MKPVAKCQHEIGVLSLQQRSTSSARCYAHTYLPLDTLLKHRCAKLDALNPDSWLKRLNLVNFTRGYCLSQEKITLSH